MKTSPTILTLCLLLLAVGLWGVVTIINQIAKALALL